jgi:hypothetical protein
VRATLVFVGNRRLRYLIEATEGPASVTITTIGGASPDLLVDTVAGPLKRIVRAGLDGYGSVPVGYMAPEHARALLLGGVVGLPTARATIARRSGFATFAIDASVDDQGRPLLIVYTSGAGAAYLDLVVD